MGTKKKQKIPPPPHPSLLPHLPKKPKRSSLIRPQVHVEPFYWLYTIFISKIVCHQISTWANLVVIKLFV